MRLTDKPEQDVVNAGNKMDKMDRQISGTGSAPTDLSTLVTPAFIYCEVLEFYLKDTGLHDLIASNPNPQSADKIIRNLKTKCWSLKAQGLRSPSERKKLDMEGDLDGLNISMNKLAE